MRLVFRRSRRVRCSLAEDLGVVRLAICVALTDISVLDFALSASQDSQLNDLK
jgi:hypothetical protein